MSLRGLQQAWLSLLFNEQDRNEFYKEGFFRGLQESEQSSFRAIDLQTIERLALDNHAHRQWILLESLPFRVRLLLGESHSEALIEQILEQHLEPPLFPLSRLRSVLLQHVQIYLSQHHLIIPYLRDVLNYEQAATHLSFFALPRPAQSRPGPYLADWARIVRLGEQFPLVLDYLNREQLPQGLSEGEKHLFLLIRDFRGLRLESPHPHVAACLELCQGQKSWRQLTFEILGEEDSKQNPVLQEWFQHYVQRGILIQAIDT